MKKRPDEIYAEQKKLAVQFADWSTENPPAGISSEARKIWKVYFSERYDCFYLCYVKFFDLDEVNCMLAALTAQINNSSVTWPFSVKYKYDNQNIKDQGKNIAINIYKDQLKVLRGNSYVDEDNIHISLEESITLGFFTSTAHALANLKLFDYVVIKDGKLWIELDDIAYENQKINGSQCCHIQVTNK